MGLKVERKVKGRRKIPYPNSILDRNALVESLDEAGISVKRKHLDAFYQALHRQHYPPLSTFVENYYMYERGEAPEDEENLPIKNPITKKKKSRNKLQLPKLFLDFLDKTPDYVTLSSRVQQQRTSLDKSTTKVIVELFDGQCVESVIMRYDRKGSGRTSLCVSSQVGCAMGCTFCATGTMGLSGNLSAAEILEQMVHANNILARAHEEHTNRSKTLDLVRNVVFMGMGEPLDNYNNVVAACRGMMDRKRWNLAQGRITVSTVGLVSQIRRLSKELPEVSLALSLHAPNQQAREAIVPTASRYPVQDLIDALDGHMMAVIAKKSGEEYTLEERIKASSRRRAMIEYVMLEGESSSFECAHQLGKLCENRQLLVNLIPYNQTDVKDKLRCPSREHMQEFRDIVASYGAFCTIRRTMGADIAGACGQLVKQAQDEESEKAVKSEQEELPSTTVDIEDVVGGRVPGSSQPNTATNKNGKQTTPISDEQDQSNNSGVAVSWFDKFSDEDLKRMEYIVSVAATVSASCFLVSAVMSVRRR